MQEKRIGRTAGGMEVFSYRITDEDGNGAELSNYGATLLSFVTDIGGEQRDIVLGYEKAGDYFENGACMGAVVGRNANRIADAAFELGGRHYRLKANDGKNNLHSGGEGFHYRCWKVLSHDDHSVTFEIESPDMDCGFPGNLTAGVTYTLEAGALIIDYKGISDRDTIFNPTNHAYFNLDGHSNGTVLEHALQINGDTFAVGGEEALPRGEIRPVAGTPMDFTNPHRIGERLKEDYDELRCAGGYNHCYGLNREPKYREERFCREGLEVFFAAALTSGDGKLRMNMYTSSVGLQLYPGNGLNGELGGKGGAVYGPYSGVALESQYFPNAINVPSFVSPVLKAGEERQLRTVYEVKR